MGYLRQIRWYLKVWLLIGAVASLNQSAFAFPEHLFVLTSDFPESGNSAALDILPPWNPQVDLEPVGARATLRHFQGRHYVVNHSPLDNVQVIDPETFDTVLEFPVGSGTDPRDIAWIDDQIAYVSCWNSQWLYLIDPSNGAMLDSLSLAGFSDPDGLPEMGTMARDGDHLLVQIRRLDRQANLTPVPPSYLAVVDVTTNQLLDVDPMEPGVQGIQLQGTVPSFKMQLEARRLFVSVPGIWFESDGGIEEIDLDNLQSLGFLTSEVQIPAAQMGTFILVSPEKGYVINHTDIVLSSHLMSFSRLDGSPLAQVMYTLETAVENLAFDPATHQLFFPDSGSPATGVRVLDTSTDTELTTSPISTGLPPRDLVVARPPGPAAVGREETRRTGTGDIQRESEFWGIFPNPFNPKTTIGYYLDRQKSVHLSVLDISGRRLAVLVDQVIEAGHHQVEWSGRDSAGQPVSSGTYILRMETPDKVESRRALLIR